MCLYACACVGVGICERESVCVCMYVCGCLWGMGGVRNRIRHCILLVYLFHTETHFLLLSLSFFFQPLFPQWRILRRSTEIRNSHLEHRCKFHNGSVFCSLVWFWNLTDKKHSRKESTKLTSGKIEQQVHLEIVGIRWVTSQLYNNNNNNNNNDNK